MILDWIILSLVIITFILALISFVILLLRKPDKSPVLDENALKSDLSSIYRNELIQNNNNITNVLNVFSKSLQENLDLMKELIASKVDVINQNQSKYNLETEQKLENIRRTVENSLNNSMQNTERKLEEIRSTMEKAITNLQEENVKKLDEMRETVDEKLQKTLEDRISKSFKLVSERLEQVHQGLGEMQSLASGVGDLKKVLSNVKTRGVLGEIQLRNILEEILTPDQYVENYATKRNSNNRVEFAIKLPGDDEPIYLPIDAKFPLEDYQQLLDAYNEGNSELVKKHQNQLMQRIKNSAKDIRDKYIDVPHTTEFGIMFLPIEGLYAEVVKLGLVEELQRTYRINIAGPTTMAALLNSLQMGFKTLAIQKRSGEVWNVLAAVKAEFNTFGNVLESARSRINQANDDLEKLIGTRTRQIQRKLKDVESLENYDTNILIPKLGEED